MTKNLRSIGHKLFAQQLLKVTIFAKMGKISKNDKLDDVIKGWWRHHMNSSYSTVHTPIDYLSYLGSDIAVSFMVLEIRALPVGTLASCYIYIYRPFTSHYAYIGAGTSHRKIAITFDRNNIFWWGKKEELGNWKVELAEGVRVLASTQIPISGL